MNINVQIIYRIVDDGVVLLPFVVSLKAGSITGVPMSPGYGGYQSTTPLPYYTTTTFAPTGYYTEAHNYYITKAPEYYTADNAAPSYIIKDPEYYTEAPKCYTTKSPEYYTYVAPAYYTEVSKNYLVPSYYTEAPTYYTTKAVEYYTESPNYYTTKALEYYTTTYASPSHNTATPKYYSASS
jgi:hypothetical protein